MQKSARKTTQVRNGDSGNCETAIEFEGNNVKIDLARSESRPYLISEGVCPAAVLCSSDRETRFLTIDADNYYYYYFARNRHCLF